MGQLLADAAENPNLMVDPELMRNMINTEQEIFNHLVETADQARNVRRRVAGLPAPVAPEPPAAADDADEAIEVAYF